jgi:magnesium transporter
MRANYCLDGGKIIARDAGACIHVFVAPDEEERRELVEDFRLDPHDLASALDPDELGRLETGNGQITIIMKQPRNYTSAEQLLFTVTSMGLFLESKRLVAVTTDELDLFEDRMIHKVANPRDALLKIFYGAIAHFLGHLKVINMLSESLEKRVNASMGNRYLLDMFTLEKSLVYFVNGIASNQMVLDKMRTTAGKIHFTAAQREVLEDIYIENLQCSKQAEIYSNILTGLMDARGSVVNNNLSLLMKKLTVISVIFMPMNVLAGMGGMSEYSDWIRDHMPWYVGYPIFLAGLILVGMMTYWVLRKTGVERDEIPQGRVRIPRVSRRGRKAAAKAHEDAISAASMKAE